MPLIGGLASARTAGGGTALFLGERGARRRPGRHAPGRRGDASVRIAGRRADRPGADDHGVRGHVIVRARRQAGARQAARDDRDAAGRRPRAGSGRPADGDRRRLEQAGLRAGRLPRARAGRRRPGHRPGRRRRRGAAGPGRAAARPRRGERRPRPARRARRAHASARRPHAGGRAGVRVQRPRARAVRRAATTTPRPSRRSSAGAPAAGFFAAGEIGPVGGESFLHGFTATVAVFA